MRVKNGIACLGSKIIINKQCIGEVTSSSWSPYQECGVSIVRLKMIIMLVTHQLKYMIIKIIS